MRVLVVEDDVKMASLLRRGLLEEGLAADVARTGDDALWMAEATEYDAIVLDVMLPGADGFEVCRRLRESGRWSPVLMLTARDAVEDRVAGLDAGADDYLTKPFSFAELLARLRALARRAPLERPAVLEAGDLRLDPATRRAWRGDVEIGLSAKEFALLETFMRRPGEVLRYQLSSTAGTTGTRTARTSSTSTSAISARRSIGPSDGSHSRRSAALGTASRATREQAAHQSAVDAGLRGCDGRRARSDRRAGLSGPALGARRGDQRLTAEPGGGPGCGPGSGGELRREPGEVIDGSGRVVAEPGEQPLLGAEDLARVEPGGELRLERDHVAGIDGRARLLATAVDSRVVVAAASLDDRDGALGDLFGQLLIFGPAALLLAALLGYGLATAALRPVEAMREEAATISGAEPGRRLPIGRANDELGRLGTTLNDMLERLDGALEHERSFIADASHELRTPLALLKAELELSLRRPRSAEELEEALRSAATETDRLTQLAEHLLVLARSDQGRLTLRRESILAESLATEVAGRFAAGRRPIEVDVPTGLDLSGDRVRLEQALGDLVANALEHGVWRGQDHRRRGRRTRRAARPRRGGRVHAGLSSARLRALHPRGRSALGRRLRPRPGDRRRNRAWARRVGTGGEPPRGRRGRVAHAASAIIL